MNLEQNPNKIVNVNNKIRKDLCIMSASTIKQKKHSWKKRNGTPHRWLKFEYWIVAKECLPYFAAILF